MPEFLNVIAVEVELTCKILFLLLLLVLLFSNLIFENVFTPSIVFWLISSFKIPSKIVVFWQHKAADRPL